MESGTPDLPQDIITSILVQLPVKSLIRFQCACKDWNNMFKTQYFIAKHLHHSTLQNPSIIVGNVISESNSWHLRLLNREMQVFESPNTYIIDSLMPKGWGWVYSSNGLLCVVISYSLWLWNPAIRVVKQVPQSLNHYEYECFSVGFGFSPIVNDYRIVKLFFSANFVVHGEVYSLRMGLWRKVEVGNLEGVYYLKRRAFPCNGHIFWIGNKAEYVEGHRKNLLDLIVSFDIAKEVFTLIPYPAMAPTYGFYITLASYENKLAVFFGTEIENSTSYVIDLWVLEECAYPSRERWSWAKIYTIKPRPFHFIIWPKIIWRNKIVCLVEGAEENYKGKFVLCNLTTDEFNFFDNPIWSNCPGILDYVESLVLLDNVHI